MNEHRHETINRIHRKQILKEFIQSESENMITHDDHDDEEVTPVVDP